MVGLLKWYPRIGGEERRKYFFKKRYRKYSPLVNINHLINHAYYHLFF